MMSSQTLFRSGLILTHDDNDHVVGVEADLLVEGNLIKLIGHQIEADEDAKIIDCSNKIICPGFIDTHHHLWQALLKGAWNDYTLLDIFCKGSLAAAYHDPTDIFWAVFGAALECIDAGSTTVVDHAHFHYTPEHARAAITALADSGLRSVFCYSPHSRATSFKPFELDREVVTDWMMDTIEDLAKNSPYGNGRVEMGFGMDEFPYSGDKTAEIFNKVKSWGIKTITSHYIRNPAQAQSSRIAMFSDWGILDSMIVSHVVNPEPGDAALLKAHNAYMATAPSSAMAKAMGRPSALYHPTEDLYSCASIGSDSHATNTASIPLEMRALLSEARASSSQAILDQNKIPRKLHSSAEAVFNLGTVKGARALGKADQIGRLQAGMLADIVVFDTTTPGMSVHAQYDPVGAIIVHSTQKDIELVMVDGIIRKEHGRLVDVKTSAQSTPWLEGEKEILSWSAVSKKMVEKSKLIHEREGDFDLGQIKEQMIDLLKLRPRIQGEA